MRALAAISLLTASLLLAATPARAQEAEWLAYDYADAAGRTMARLQFGLAATDELAFTAGCAPGAAEVAVALYVATGTVQPGDPATLRIATPGRAESRPGAVVEDAFGTHAVAQLRPDDPIWAQLAAGLTASIGIDGAAATDIHLRGSRVAIDRFLASCALLAASPVPADTAADDTAAAAAPAEAPAPPAEDAAPAEAPAGGDGAGGQEAGEQEASGTGDEAASGTAAAQAPLVPVAPPAPPPAPPYPLYVTGDEPVPAFSAMRFGIVLDPLPPGSTVRRTGNTGVRDTHEWVEVTTVGERARTVWVLREQLEPSAAGASAYQNPSPAATLLIRAEPATDAAVVGAIPARAVGILDQGQRQGDWVMVSFGGTTGWVSHLFLLPIGPELPSAEPEDVAATAGADAVAEPYTATHGAWTVDCDPCRDPALGAACSIASPSRATVRRLAVLALEPEEDGVAPRARYASGADLPEPADAILTVAVDAAPPQSVATEGWRLEAESGDALIAAGALAPLLPAVRGGALLTISVSDGARIWTDQFALAGFPAALDDLTARLPMPSRFGDAEACPVEEPDTAEASVETGPADPDPAAQP